LLAATEPKNKKIESPAQKSPQPNRPIPERRFAFTATRIATGTDAIADTARETNIAHSETISEKRVAKSEMITATAAIARDSQMGEPRHKRSIVYLPRLLFCLAFSLIILVNVVFLIA